MKSLEASARTLSLVSLIALTPPFLAAQSPRYKLIDIGTLGGPSAYGSNIGPGAQLLNAAGTVAGTADTATQDPNCGCFVSLGLRWQDGVLTALSPVPGGVFTGANAIDARGWVVGFSDTSVTDPVSGGPAIHAVLWKGADPVDLGTLGTGVESAAWYVKDSGQVVGNATIDTTADPFSANNIGPFGSPTHVFAWKNGTMRDIGTLGGKDSFAAPGCNNQRDDLVAGTSFVDSIPNADTGLPTLDPFLWKDGAMTDLGSLGGDFGFALCTNNRGQVIGQSSISGAECFTNEPGCHAFLWNGSAMTDLGTLGGSSSSAYWLSEGGDVVGNADIGDGVFHATLWRNGAITDLGTLPGDCASLAWSINSRGQIVGFSFNCDTQVAEVVLWDHGSIVDLNVASPEPLSINDRGEIAGVSLPPGCNETDLCAAKAFLLVPCHAGDQGCDHGEMPAQTPVASIVRDSAKARELVAQWRARLARRQGAPRPSGS
jgi:probable HAF family extracellular repeat protein